MSDQTEARTSRSTEEPDGPRVHVEGLGLVNFAEVVDQVRRWKASHDRIEADAIAQHDELIALRSSLATLQQQHAEQDARVGELEAKLSYTTLQRDDEWSRAKEARARVSELEVENARLRDAMAEAIQRGVSFMAAAASTPPGEPV